MLPDVAAFSVFASTVAVVPKGFAPVEGVEAIADARATPSGAEMSYGATRVSIPDNCIALALRRDQVPILPEGSTIEGSLDGRPSALYRVHYVDDRDPQYHMAWVSL